MRAIANVLALTAISMQAALMAVSVDAAPSQTPAQIEESAPAVPIPGLTSQPDKAAAAQADKSKKNAQLAAKTPAKETAAKKAPQGKDKPRTDQ